MPFLSQGLSTELGPKGVYVQAVLPAATPTEIWEGGGADPCALRSMMEVGDAALVGFDRREPATIRALPQAAQSLAYQSARQAMLPDFAQTGAAARYRTGAYVRDLINPPAARKAIIKALRQTCPLTGLNPSLT